MSLKLQIAVVGALSQMGGALLEKLAEALPKNVKVLAVDADDKDGEVADYGHIELSVHPVSEFSFESVSAALFVEPAPAFSEARQAAEEAGITVIEFAALQEAAKHEAHLAAKEEAGGLRNKVRMPPLGVLPLAIALKALAPFGLEAVTVASYQSASHMGKSALEELAAQTTALFTQRDAEVEVFSKRLAFNLLPAVGDLNAAGESEEERLLAVQLPKLLALPDLKVFASTAYIPAFFGASWAVTAEFNGTVAQDKISEALSAANIALNTEANLADIVTPMEILGAEQVAVERLRLQNNRLSFWVMADAFNVSAQAWTDLLRKMIGSGSFA
jgi:aspartate-semialdehyde dehydrogenase